MDKKIVIIGAVLVLVIFSILIINKMETKVTGNVVNEENIENLHETSLAIEGMYCDACAYAVKAQLEELDGVTNADIDAIDASGLVRFDADKIDAQSIAKASTAYPASVIDDRKIN